MLAGLVQVHEDIERSVKRHTITINFPAPVSAHNLKPFLLRPLKFYS